MRGIRYHLTLPGKYGADLLRISEEQSVPVLDLIRRFCALGVLESRVGPFFSCDKNGERREIEVFPPCGQDDRKLRLWCSHRDHLLSHGLRWERKKQMSEGVYKQIHPN